MIKKITASDIIKILTSHSFDIELMFQSFFISYQSWFLTPQEK